MVLTVVIGMSLQVVMFGKPNIKGVIGGALVGAGSTWGVAKMARGWAAVDAYTDGIGIGAGRHDVSYSIYRYDI